MSDKHSAKAGCDGQYLLVALPSQARGVSRLEVDARLSPKRRFHDDVVQVGVGLEADSYQ